MVDSITLHLLDLEIKECKKRDLEQKLSMACNIVEKFLISEEYYNKRQKKIKHVAIPTGVSNKTLERVQEYNAPHINFKDWLCETEYNSDFYQNIRVHLWNYYTQSHDIPTNQQFQELIKCSRPRTAAENERQFFKFFTSVRLPGTEASIIVEKPEIIMRRFQYLHTKLSYHNKGIPVVYIGAVDLFAKHGISKISKCIKDNTRVFYLAASRCGYISSLCSRGADEMSIKLWVMDKVIATLAPGTVLVVCDDIWSKKGKPPVSLASKTEMIDWLSANEIPHDPKAHRAELFSLIENYRVTCRSDTAEMEKLITNKGYVVLQRPKEVGFHYFQLFWKRLKERLVFKRDKTRSSVHALPDNAKIIASSLSFKYWTGLEMDLLNKEVDSYNADLKVETVIDKLMTFTKYERLSHKYTSDLDPYCEAMDTEYIFDLNN